MSEFKTGDLLVCVNSSKQKQIAKGLTYVVTKADGDTVYLEGVKGRFYTFRFTKVLDEAPTRSFKPSLYKIIPAEGKVWYTENQKAAASAWANGNKVEASEADWLEIEVVMVQAR